MRPPGEVTRLLAEVSNGSRDAEDQLIQLVYRELLRRAEAYMRKERPNHTLQASGLVHEAYLRLMPQQVTWQNRQHFLGVATEQMRRVLVDHARRRNAARREGAGQKIQLRDALVMAHERPSDFLELDEALRLLAVDHERQYRVVELRFFGGYNEEEVARILSISLETVKRDWRFAKVWIREHLSGAAQ